MADEAPKTRTRSTQSDKAAQTEQEQSAAEKRKADQEAKAAEKAKRDEDAKAKREEQQKERAEKREAEKKEREEKRAADKAEREQKREEEKAAKEQEKIDERQRQIDAGEIIFANTDREPVEASDANGDWEGFTFTKTTPKKEEVAQRAKQVIQDLMAEATEVPLAGKDLAARYGGGTVQWVSFFGMLRVLGMIQPYRFRSASLGESGLSYLWVYEGDVDLDALSDLAEEGESEDEPLEDTQDETVEEVVETEA